MAWDDSISVRLASARKKKRKGKKKKNSLSFYTILSTNKQSAKTDPNALLTVWLLSRD